jgi:hypothetical protein
MREMQLPLPLLDVQRKFLEMVACIRASFNATERTVATLRVIQRTVAIHLMYGASKDHEGSS